MFRHISKLVRTTTAALAKQTAKGVNPVSTLNLGATRGMATIMDRDIDMISGFTEEQRQVRHS